MIKTTLLPINASVLDHAPVPGTLEPLINAGVELFQRGCYDEAMNVFDVAFSVTKCPSAEGYAAASKYLERSYESIINHQQQQQQSRATQDNENIDLYQEDECDVGPRVLMNPARLLESQDKTLMEATIVFNKALVCHALCQYSEAKKLYQSVLLVLRTVFASPVTVPSHLLMELGMRAENNIGFINYCEGDEELSLVSFEAALFFAKHLANTSASYQLEYANVLSNKCRVSWMHGDISDTLYQDLCEVLKVRATLLPSDHPDVASSHFNLAMAEHARRCYSQAVPHLLRYLQICAAGDKELDSVPGLVYLMLIRHEDRDDSMSQELVRGLRTLQDKRHDLGPRSAEVASVLNYIGTLLFHQEDFENALLFFQEELRLEDCLAETCDDISTSVTCNNIGRILQELGKFPEAIVYYQRALKTEYGDVSQLSFSCKGAKTCTLRFRGHADASSSSSNLYSTVWYNLGLIHDKLGSYDDAIFAFEMSLGLRRAMLGPDHPDIACLLYNIGVLRMERQQLQEASECFREALRVRRIGAAGQLNDRHVVKTLEKLSSLHRAKGNIKGALEAANEVLAIQEVSPDYDDMTRMKESGATLRSISELHHAVGDLTSSMKTATASVHNLRSVVVSPANNSHPELLEQIANVEQLASSLLLLGSLYHESCEPVEASLILEEASAILARAVNSTVYSHSLAGLQEVTRMLASSHCAPEA